MLVGVEVLTLTTDHSLLTMEVITGIFYHAIGASSASLCYTPQKRLVQWSWQTYWLAQAAVCWLLLPVIVAWLTIPDLMTVLREAPSGAMWRSFLLGMGYGIGGTAFGMAIRYVGISLTYAIAVGISCVLGTLLPPWVAGELGALFQKNGSGYIILGITLGAMGIALCGAAGRYKELDLAKDRSDETFSLAKGLPLCLLAGVLSAVYGYSISEGAPIAAVAEQHGSGHFKTNVIYIFSNSGAFVTTLVYCLYLHGKHKTFGEYKRLKTAGNGALRFNFAMALLTGVLWYGQFFFYGLGHVRMGAYQFTSWAIHMIMLVLFSTIAGLMLKEWAQSRSRTKQVLAGALVVLTLAVIILTYGNYLGST
jgi:L-rhamnose-H+ transport protein